MAERSRVLFYPVRIVVRSAAIVVSLQSLHQDNRFSSNISRRLLLLHFPVDLVACFYIGVPATNTEFLGCSISCFFSANHRLVLIVFSFERPTLVMEPLVSRFQRVGTKKSGFCIAFCSDSLIFTDLRVLVHRRTSVAENAIVLSLPTYKLSSPSVR